MEVASTAAEDDDWNGVRDAETTSSEDELLSTVMDEGDEAATWLVDVGLGKIVDTLMENGGHHQVTEMSLANAAREEGLTSHQFETVRRRVETLRATLRNRKTRANGGHHQRPDVRDIFRDPDVINSGGSSGRSRSATPDSLDSSENVLGSSPVVSPKTWSRSGSNDEDQPDAPPVPSPPMLLDTLTQLPAIVNPKVEPRRRFNYSQADKLIASSRPNRTGFFTPAAEGHVAATDKAGIEIVKYNLVGTLSVAHGRRSSNEPSADEISHLPTIHQPQQQQRISLQDVLTAAQRRKLRQLALLELTSLMDSYGLAVRKRRIIRVRTFAYQSRSERNVFGVPIKKLTDRDQSRVPGIFTLMIDLLRKNHLDEEGLLRVPGSKQKIAALNKLVESIWKSSVDLKSTATVRSHLTSAGPHELASLMKQFLRQLPESLFTQDSVELFAQVADVSVLDDQLKALNLLIVQLPDPNCQTLRVLLRFLAEVDRHSPVNKMTLNNIATVMGPNLFPPNATKTGKNSRETYNEAMAFTTKTNRVTELLLTHQDELFTIPQDILTQLSQIKVK